VTWDIEKDYYLYVGMINFSLIDTNKNNILEIELPKGLKKTDEFFGEVDIYKGRVSANVFFENPIDSIKFQVMYQGCAEAGLCYPPIKKTYTLDSTTSDVGSFLKTSTSSDQITISKQLYDESILANVLLFFIGGLLLGFTPCVFPMIPILTGLIVGQGSNINSRQAFMLSFTYVVSMALAYSVLGIIVALSGANIQASLQSPIVIYLFATLFIILSLAMLGIFSIEMPSKVKNFLIVKSNKAEAGNYLGVGIMGILSALIVGPCVTAPLIGALIYIASSGDVILGGLALFAMGLGMGTPLLVLGTSASKLMKKIGIYLPLINKLFGILFLVVAIWLLERVTSIEVSALAWSLLALTTLSILLYSKDITINKNFRTLAFFTLTSYVILQIVGINKNNYYNPVFSFIEVEQNLHFKTVFEPEKLFQEIKSSEKYTMVDIYADWCVACKELEKYTFTDSSVSGILKTLNLVKFDITKTNEGSSRFLRDFRLFGPPVIMFFDSNGNEIVQSRIVGFVDSEQFIEKFNQIDKNLSEVNNSKSL
tara:strand:- start:386 stop:2002 length:1617 start_codon:yes stop_codon:yes gene_type:complete